MPAPERPEPLRAAADPGPLPPLAPALAEGDAIALPPTDNTPNDAPPEPATRVPHLGHALLFLGITAFLLVVLLNGLALATHLHNPHEIHPKVIVAAETLAYLGALGVSFFLFPRLWQRSFLLGLRWNSPAARRNALRLIPLGLALSATVQAISTRLSIPKDLPMDDFFRSPSDIWLLALFGTILAPLFEEVLFRGFLLPAFAIAYDWLALPRTPAAREAWHSSNRISHPAWIFSAVLTSVFFTLLHGQQTAFTWPVLALLFVVSLVLTAVRLRFRSVAASTVVHAAYNGFVFLVVFFVTGGFRHLDKLPK